MNVALGRALRRPSMRRYASSRKRITLGFCRHFVVGGVELP